VRLLPALEPGLAVVDEGPLARDRALAALATAASPVVGLASADLTRALVAREELRSTQLDHGVAVPHAIVGGVRRTLVIPMLVRRGVPFDPATPPATLLFALFGAPAGAREHVRLLARIARIAQDGPAIEHIRVAIDADDLWKRLVKEDARHD
jgi:mannitol/fructose-specific phosphotransferase system IIA component (Ntr-type)